MRRHLLTYWLFQLCGWTVYCLVYIFFYIKIRTAPQPYFYEQLIAHAVLGLLFTHLMRFVIHQAGILSLPVKKQVASLFLASLCCSFLIGASIVFAERLLGIQNKELSLNYTMLNLSIRFAFSYFHFILLWNLLYVTYHYVRKTRQQQLDQARLEGMLKELEIKTLKAHINPHFIFNSLNSIRALVMEDPVRARSAITQLSNILRSSMQGDKMEKTLFEKEINIVKDYLALEKIRFEDRLDISYDIDDETLDQPVPPMMLQALVENALKYGVSNDIKGGNIRISSQFDGDIHEFAVLCSGNVEEYSAHENHAITDLKNRLFIGYGKGASLTIIGDKDKIAARVRIPV
ncbi:sensor histidine kinase [Sediminibacterium ginsengisoli]|uniref:Histidine kinase n=1 Tax=Sediminibacterium ginsengisoli TaxID=413434 RepID=A0A1T4Q051_9BACT|nr:histidine kinase [Sediminibacterium ginsengisoli]SJZ96881.1 Histidine kinase [Sediminibacterium ginsengisoli]